MYTLCYYHSFLEITLAGLVQIRKRHRAKKVDPGLTKWPLVILQSGFQSSSLSLW